MMGYSSREIDRVVFREVPETCPHVDAALEAAAGKIKEQTGRLRDALTEYVERALNAEDELDTANDRIKELEKEVEELSARIAHLEYKYE
jgi:predicted  nucleic acid-binding Zn-ribbon protein